MTPDDKNSTNTIWGEHNCYRNFAHGIFQIIAIKTVTVTAHPIKFTPLCVVDCTCTMKYMCWWKEMKLQSECDIISCHIFHKLTVSYLTVPLVCGGNKLGDKTFISWGSYFVTVLWEQIEQITLWGNCLRIRCKICIKRVKIHCVVNCLCCWVEKSF